MHRLTTRVILAYVHGRFAIDGGLLFCKGGNAGDVCIGIITCVISEDVFGQEVLMDDIRQGLHLFAVAGPGYRNLDRGADQGVQGRQQGGGAGRRLLHQCGG